MALRGIRILSKREHARLAKLAPDMAAALAMQDDFERAYVAMQMNDQVTAAGICRHYRVESLQDLVRATTAVRKNVLAQVRAIGGRARGVPRANS